MEVNALALRAAFCCTDGQRDDAVEDTQLAVILAMQQVNDLAGIDGAHIRHCYQDTFNFQLGIDSPLYICYRMYELLQALNGQVMGHARDYSKHQKYRQELTEVV